MAERRLCTLDHLYFHLEFDMWSSKYVNTQCWPHWSMMETFYDLYITIIFYQMNSVRRPSDEADNAVYENGSGNIFNLIVRWQDGVLLCK